ncbi:MAG: hypothetical protein MJE77_08165 [Proteobacteria bacterium]|nr:hypothetical protein [Pseudomonadota bacterium]
MKRYLPNFGGSPRNSNRPVEKSATTDSLFALSSAFGAAAREFTGMIEDLLSTIEPRPNLVATNATRNSRREERPSDRKAGRSDGQSKLRQLLQSGIASSVEPFIAQWKARLDDVTAGSIADVLIFNAAALMGRRVLSGECGKGQVVDKLSDAHCAREFLARLCTFAELFGHPDSWNGAAARRYALNRLARPAGILSEDESGVVQPAFDVFKQVSMELTARSWRDIVSISLDLPVRLPAHPAWSQNWHGTVDRKMLERALERAIAGDGLIHTVWRQYAEVKQILLSQNSLWLLVRDAEHRMPGRPADCANRADRIDRVDLTRVMGALECHDTIPIEQWNSAALSCPPPDRIIRAPRTRNNGEFSVEEMALVRQKTADRVDMESLAVVVRLRESWEVWLIPTVSAEHCPGELVLWRDDQEVTPSTGMSRTRFTDRPLLVRGACTEPLVLTRDTPARIVRLGRTGKDEKRAKNRPKTDLPGMAMAGSSGHRIDAVYSLADDPRYPPGHVLLTGGSELRLYRSNSPGKTWWQGDSLELEAEATLVANAAIFGMINDLIVFQLANRLWGFFPLRALADSKRGRLAQLRAQARGILFRGETGEFAAAYPVLRSWIHVGRLSDVCGNSDGTISVTFADSARTELYEPRDGPVPVLVHSVENRRGSRGARTSHLKLPDNRYLLVRARDDHVEFKRIAELSRDHDDLLAQKHKESHAGP